MGNHIKHMYTKGTSVNIIAVTRYYLYFEGKNYSIQLQIRYNYGNACQIIANNVRKMLFCYMIWWCFFNEY